MRKKPAHSKQHTLPRNVFDLEKTTQAVAYILRKYNGRLDYRKLLTLMYLADKEAINRHCISITGDDYIALPADALLKDE